MTKSNLENSGLAPQELKAIDTTNDEIPTIEQILEMDVSNATPFSQKRIECQYNGSSKVRTFIVGADRKYHLLQKAPNNTTFQETDKSFTSNNMVFKVYKDFDGNIWIRQYAIDKNGNPETAKNGSVYPKGWLKIMPQQKDKLKELIEEGFGE